MNCKDWSNRDFTTESEKGKQQLEKVDTTVEKTGCELVKEKENVRESVGGEAQHNWTEVETLSDGSPVLRSLKRSLNISPSTPAGLQRKHQTHETQKDLHLPID